MTLTAAQMPSHTHPALANASAGTATVAAGNVLAGGGTASLYVTETPVTPMGTGTSPAGDSLPHDNRQPLLAVTFIIALFGIFPSQG